MNGKEKAIESDPPDLGRFLDVVIFHYFRKSIISTSDDQNRTKLAMAFGMNPRVRHECILRIFEHIKEIGNTGEHVADVELLNRYAGIMAQVFIRNRTRRRRHGFETETLTDDGEIIFSLGHSLNEGVTEWLARKVTASAISERKLELPEGSDAQAEAYALEVALAERLISIFGEEVVTKAYFDGASYDDLVKSVEKRFGEGAFLKIMQLSDEGKWRDTFRFIDSSEQTATAAEEEASGGPN